jgi:urease accessory protein
MLLVERIIGDAKAPEFAGRIHHLDHHHAVEYLEIPTADLARRRLRTTLPSGEEIAIALQRDEALFDRAVLLLEQDRAIVVRVLAERWLRLAPASSAGALQLGYHAGNLHWRVRFGGGVLFIALDGPEDAYLARIQGLLDHGDVTASVVGSEALPC